MKKSIATLSEDIYNLFSTSDDLHTELDKEVGSQIADEIARAITREEKPREKGKLWASDLGKQCMRQHWFNFNEDTYGEPLMGHTRFKFLYGNILEGVVLGLAKTAGHDVTMEQEVVEHQLNDTWTIRGRTDAAIDDAMIDVKTASSYAYKKYSQGIDSTNDSFGYLYQLGFYKFFGAEGAYADRDDQGFVFIDKQNGHIKYVKAETPTKDELIQRGEAIVEAVQTEDVEDVARGYADKPYGKSGNRALDIACAYCPFKQECWPGLRTFLYNQGPVDFTHVAQEPRVPEITGR